MSSREEIIARLQMEERMDAIRLKQILGGELTEKELMCLQIEQNGGGCASCGVGFVTSDSTTEKKAT